MEVAEGGEFGGPPHVGTHHVRPLTGLGGLAEAILGFGEGDDDVLDVDVRVLLLEPCDQLLEDGRLGGGIGGVPEGDGAGEGRRVHGPGGGALGCAGLASARSESQ